MTFGGILSIARSGLFANQTQVQITSQNIANAEVPGYSRQRAVVTASYPQTFPFGNLGTGVTVNNIESVRDQFLDATYRQQSTNSGYTGMQSDLLGGVGQILNEPSDSGLSASLDAFWNAWSDLANNPTLSAAKSSVRQAGGQVANQLNSIDQQLTAQDQGNRAKLTNTIAQYNTFAKQVADLNTQIVAAEVGGHTAGDLRDARDRLIDQMSAMADTSVVENANGSVTVHLGTNTVVDASNYHQLELRTSGSQLAVGWVGDANNLRQLGGQIGAMLDYTNTTVPGLRAKLDQVAQTIVTQVNAVHEQGWSAAGDALGAGNWNIAAPPTGSMVDFFDPTKVTAATISLSSAVQNDVNVIAVGSVQGATGNNTTANALAALRDQQNVGLGTQSIADYYRGTVAQVGLDTQSANDASNVATTLVTQADTRRQSVSGVSTDEELINLTKYQQAYAAAAKLVTTVDQMMDTLLTLKST